MSQLVDRVSWRNLSVGDIISNWGAVARISNDGIVLSPSLSAIPEGLLVPLASKFGDYKFDGVEPNSSTPAGGQPLTEREIMSTLPIENVTNDWDKKQSGFGPWPARFKGARIAYFDTETTGFDPEDGDRMIEIACVIMEEEEGIIFEWSELINPGRKIPPASTNIHGITDDKVRSARRDDLVIPEFLEIIASSDYIAAHNLPFDKKFLRESVDRNGLDWPVGKRAIDTLPISQEFLKRGSREGMVKNHRLGTLIKHFGFEHGTAHRALDDTIGGARVLNSLLIMMHAQESGAQE